MVNTKYYHFSIHILAWSIFILLPLFAVPRLANLVDNEYAFKISYIVGSITTICFYYLSYYVLIPTFLFKKKYLLFFILCLFCLGISIIMTRFLFMQDFVHENSMNLNQPKLFGNYLLRFLIIFLAAFAFRFHQKTKQMEGQQALSELENLKAQVNPHFLFNNLNGIYGLALTKSDKTADYISKLSSILRYSMSEISTEKVPLKNEIQFLMDYVELQKIRLTETTEVIFTVNGHIESHIIAPLLFINFIENAFKYGVSNEVTTEIIIHFEVEKKSLLMFVKNDIINQNQFFLSHEMGLKYIKRRLDLIYENNHSLKIDHSANKFQVHLLINQL